MVIFTSIIIIEFSKFNLLKKFIEFYPDWGFSRNYNLLWVACFNRMEVGERQKNEISLTLYTQFLLSEVEELKHTVKVWKISLQTNYICVLVVGICDYYIIGLKLFL